jgi:uncharacterized protein
MAVSRIWRKSPEYYNLIGKICPECNTYFFPKRPVCRKCGCTELQDYAFIGKGVIETYTIIRTPVSDPENENIDIPARDIPYVLAIIKLDEGPSLTAQIVDCSESELKIGKKVEMVFRKILEKGSKGVIQYGYKFRII